MQHAAVAGLPRFVFRRLAQLGSRVIVAGVDGCVAPVLDLSEAPAGAHLGARGTFTEAFGVTQPEPAPRMSRTPGRIQSGPTEPGADSVDVLRAWGFDTADIDRLIARRGGPPARVGSLRERT